MFNFNPFYQLIAQSPMSHWLETLPAQLAHWQRENVNANVKHWLNAFEHLPELRATHIELTQGVLAQCEPPLISGKQKELEMRLRGFMPWRKGPYSLYGVDIETEWRSDFKWDRLLPHISPLKDRLVLDVGCGNGYHLWRMVGEGAKLAVGIDPTTLFLFQFETVRKLLNDDQRAHLLPLGIEQLPDLECFDTVFSMGVLYHRRSPIDHLYQLKGQLAQGGELILETIVIDGDANTVLVPHDRYGQMRNVYFFPSALALKGWLEKCGFVDVNIVDIATTTTEEQHKTSWIATNSLEDFLDPTDPSKTIEGYPAPKRAVLVAKKP